MVQWGLFPRIVFEITFCKSSNGEKISGQVSTGLFVTGKILCKNETKNIFFENELILGAFNSQK
jgi:hypothetical protein